jgi:hypothetical protein
MEGLSRILFDVAMSDKDLNQILLLQQQNLPDQLTEERRLSQGFVTVQHNLPLLRSMNASAPQVIARHAQKVVGYALSMRPELKHVVPVLVPMFELVEDLFYRGESLAKAKYYVMGQICVDENYRGAGVFDGLYQKHRQIYSRQYDLCITEVSTRNMRSMKAHQRVGFKTIHTFRDATDEWNIVLWDWQNGSL